MNYFMKKEQVVEIKRLVNEIQESTKDNKAVQKLIKEINKNLPTWHTSAVC